MVATTILSTNPLFAMDGFDEHPINPPAKPLHKSAKILGCLPDQSGAITLSLEQLAELTNSGKRLRHSEYGSSVYRVSSSDKIYDIEVLAEGMVLITPFTIKEQEKKEPTLGSHPLKISALIAEDSSQKIQFSRKASKKVQFISDPSEDNDTKGPMFCISLVSAKQLYDELYQEQERAARIAENKAKPFMDLERVYKYNFKTVSEWISAGRTLSTGGWKTKIGDLPCCIHKDEDAGLQSSDIIYFEFVGEKEVVYESRDRFPKLCSSQEIPPADCYDADHSYYYFAGYVAGKSERVPIAFISYFKRNL